MDKANHVCLGSCQAVIGEEKYKNGLVACGNDLCEKKGVPFVIGAKCKQCSKTYEEGTIHECERKDK